jgi:TM2 domain-containing membrane protein YozV
MSEDPSSITPGSSGSNRTTIGIVGLCVGAFGVHRFMLGDTTGGILRIVITAVTCGAGGMIGIIEGIIYLMKSDAEFEQTYVIGKKAWF